MADAHEAYDLFGTNSARTLRSAAAEATPTPAQAERSTPKKLHHTVARAMEQIRGARAQLKIPASSFAEVVQAVVAFDQRGRIQLDFEESDDQYDITGLQQHDQQVEQYEAALRSDAAAVLATADVPTMTICIMIVGTRGDVQPFIGIAKRLQHDGHRVRLATHAVYRDFVTEHGVEFYPLGGDPKELAAYMVKTGGHLIPLKYETITKDVPRNMQMIDEILNSTWPAVSAPDPDARGPGQPGEPFQAQAIISNPVTYGHIHVAERLGVPLHIMFPQPWVPTVAFPHPLSNMPYDDKPQKRNYMSYKLVDLLMWQGTESIVNQFRTQVLGLRKIRKGDGGRDMLLDLAIPHAFMWSSALVPKPADWGNIYDVIGTVLLKEAGSNYTPTPELEAFLGSDGGPIFVGFGSMVIADPKATTTMIIEAARLANARVLIQSSWSDMAAGIDVPDNIFFLGNCPHDWLMPRVSAVVHHGGAGTTAAGLLAGKPTFIVPFFGDQPFWGRAVVRAGVGVEPCPIAELSVEKLHKAFVGLQTPEIRARALALRDVMASEDGVGEAVQCFYRHLPLKVMRCEVCEKNLATKWSEKDKIRLCFECEYVITSRPENAPTDISDYQCVDYRSRGPDTTLEGVSSGAGAFLHEVVGGYKDVFIKPAQGYREDGATGAVIGLTKGLASCLFIRPVQGIVLFADHVATGHHNKHREADERKVGSKWLDNTMLREAAGFKTAPVAHTASMSRNEHVHRKKTSKSDTVAVFVSVEERHMMAAKFRSILEERQLGTDKRDDFRIVTCDSNPVGTALTSCPTSRCVSSTQPPVFAKPHARTIPKMNICMLATGTWSDSLQQFVAIGLRLKGDGHRVRIATNETFRHRVTGAGLEFFPLGGQATTIGRYLVYQNDRHNQKRGFLASTRIQHDFPEYDELKAFVFSLWPACVEQDPSVPSTKFRADLIVAHPLVFGQTIVAERLGVPLHCISTTPLSKTQAFPHPLSAESTTFFPFHYAPANAATFEVIDALLWKGMHDILDSFRSYLGLFGATSRRNTLHDWQTSHSYLWNANLLPKPTDWGSEICVAGAVQLYDLNEASTFSEHAPWSTAVQDFVTDSATPVVYFGFMRADWEPSRIKWLFHEIEVAATNIPVRVIFQTFEENETGALYRSATVLEVPHSMPIKLLAPFAVGAVHWGDGSVVSSWLTAGVPSCVVARNAMQRIWGQAIAWAGVGVEPLDVGMLSSSNLARVFRQLVHSNLGETTRRMSKSFSSEVAIETAVHHIYDSLPVEGMQCDLDPTRVARMYDPEHELKLSYEAYLVVQSQLNREGEGKTEHTKYKPLKYSLTHGPKYSLRQLDGKQAGAGRREHLVYDVTSHDEPSGLRAGLSQLGISKHTKLARATSLALNVVEAPVNWMAHANWPVRVAEINAAYEKLRAERSVHRVGS